jgi:NET1-associated nuclear protein 1 (U3 small nucleolar RNA-associated protein 17)
LGASSFSLVGITNKYSVVLFGDDISSPVAEGSRANTIVGDATLGQKQTLFQDIFGASAFTNHSPIHKIDSNSVSVDMPRVSNEIAELDAPAYLMPPIESLFAPLMDSFLKPSSKYQETHIWSSEQDVEMAEQSDEGIVIIGEQRERVVDQKEMDMFVELFQQTKGWVSFST